MDNLEVGCIATQLSKSFLVAPILTATPKPWKKKSIAKDVLQLFDLPKFHRIDNDARELATLLPAVQIVDSFG